MKNETTTSIVLEDSDLFELHKFLFQEINDTLVGTLSDETKDNLRQVTRREVANIVEQVVELCNEQKNNE